MEGGEKSFLLHPPPSTLHPPLLPDLRPGLVGRPPTRQAFDAPAGPGYNLSAKGERPEGMAVKGSVTIKTTGGCAIGVLAGVFAAGCAPANKPRQDPTAPSLVYSPADRIPSDRPVERPRTSGGDLLRPGARCRVHLRRDAAGLAGQAPVSIVGASRLSELASVAGVVERVDADGITVRGNGSTYWIPRGAILAVEFPDERQP